jgi:CO dehydrogenase maturation factor
MILAVVGKGGVGKTTIASLLLRRLLEEGQRPILAIDADPSSCLGTTLGVSAPATLADQRERLREGADRPPGMSSGEYLALAAEEALVEAEGFDLLTMGRPEGPGCYCFVNNLVRDYVDRLGRSYRHILIDCEAGLEHLSRRTATRPDCLVCVTSPSRMAAETVRRSLALYRELHKEDSRAVDLVLNGFPDGAESADVVARASHDGTTFRRVVCVPQDPALAACDREARSLLSLSAESPAVQALAGWEVWA